MKLACLNNISHLGLDRLSDSYQITDNVEEASLILVRSFNMLDMEIPANWLAIARAGAGVNNIPLEKMAEKGIVVFNTPGANANGVKELVLAGMLLASRDIIGGVNWVKENHEDQNILKSIEKAKAAFGGTEILGKTIGVVGLGAVGGKVAKACDDLGMIVIGYDPYLSDEARSQISDTVKLMSDLDSLYKASDFISLHLPLLDSTKQMINARVFAALKPGCVILNFSRDQLVDDDALANAINSGIIRQYVTDFPNFKTANMPGVITIPHLGASTKESEDNCAIMAVDQLRIYIEEGSIINSVNYPRLEAGQKKTRNRLLVLHENNDSFLSELTKALGKAVLIKNLVNKSRGRYSATIFDFDEELTEIIRKQLAAITGVIRIREI